MTAGQPARASGSAAGGGGTTPAPVYALLIDGSTVEIRPASADDAAAVRDMHTALSPDNLYLRFFSMSSMHAEREAQRICREPAPDHGALLAWLDGQLVGVASYEVTGRAGAAEIAFAVPDRMHGRGIATLLLEHLVSLARQRQLQAFTAETLAENTPMLRVFADAGLQVERRMADGVFEFRFPLPAGDADTSLERYLETVASRESHADVASLRPLLQPASIAVVGAGRRRGSVGREILRNIVTAGFAGAVYPVNPRAASMEGLRCLHSVSDLPRDVDVAVLALPAAAVPDAADQCGRRAVRSLVVITSGLGVSGPDLLSTCRRYGMRLVGPNCFGIAVPGLGLDATFTASHPLPGCAGLVVQSGGIGASLLEHLSRLGIGISSFASVGDKYDVSSNDLLTWWEQDAQTRLAVLYVESFGSPRKFARTARRVGQRMPVLTVVGGRSAAGLRAAQSHSAAAATPLVTREALFAQAGVIAATSLGELVGAAALLGCQPCPAGYRVAIVSNAGGAGVLAADACGDSGLQIAALSAITRQRLARQLPSGAVVANPVDTTAAVGLREFRAALEIASGDENVDAVLAVTVPTAIADLSQAIARAAVTKPLAAALLDQAPDVRLLPRPDRGPAGTGSPAVRRDAGLAPASPADPPLPQAVPAYAFPEGAASALGHAARYSAWLRRPQGRVPEYPGIRAADARSLVSAFLAGHPDGGWLPEAAVRELLRCYQIPVVPTQAVTGEEEAVAAAAGLGGRAVLKAEAAGLVHKTESGAVKLDLHGEDEVRTAFRELVSAFGGRLSRVIVEPMLAGGVEVLVGVVQEPVFGPLVVFGLGGVATDVLGDHAARLTPLTNTDAGELIRSLRSAPLLFGHRGSPAVDTEALAGILVCVSRLADDLPEVAELDLNPVIARPDSALAADARVRLSPAHPHDPFLRQLR
jgi:acyl-CoA synthetase (NDP forming)/RimJ/RimL family protein N-acetyltransferase